MSKLQNRVYGVLGIVSKMGNWNADFSGYPKMTSDGTVFGSDKAFKYPIKKMWEYQGEKVIYIKSMKYQKGKLSPNTLKERYELIFEDEKLTKSSDTVKVLKNLFSAKDVKNFGATFAEDNNNISITGAVQIGQGINQYKDTQAQTQTILSPFQDSNKADAKNTTLGTKITSNEAHYFYPFSINPKVYEEFEQLKDSNGKSLEITEGYTREDYEDFKIAALTAATAFSSNAKEGCENEFGLFVETEGETYLPNLAEYICFEPKGEGEKNVIDVSVFCELISSMQDRILSAELYYNPYTTCIAGAEGLGDKLKMYDLFTQKQR